MRDTAWTPISDMQDLELEFQEEKIKRAVWELGSDKPPRQDGFPLLFIGLFARK